MKPESKTLEDQSNISIDQKYSQPGSEDLLSSVRQEKESIQPTGGPSESTVRKGGFLKRGIAFIFDLWMVYFTFLFFIWLARKAVYFSLLENGSLQENHPLAGPLIFTMVWVFPFLFFFYFTFFSWWGGQTPGKKIAGLRIISRKKNDLSFGQALGRSLSYLLSIFSFGLGFYMALFSREGRALHDWVSGTRVIRDS